MSLGTEEILHREIDELQADNERLIIELAAAQKIIVESDAKGQKWLETVCSMSNFSAKLLEIIKAADEVEAASLRMNDFPQGIVHDGFECCRAFNDKGWFHKKDCDWLKFKNAIEAYRALSAEPGEEKP